MFRMILLVVALQMGTRSCLNLDDQDKIIGGYDMTIQRAPYFAQICQNFSFFCGASILSHRVLLTAANCIFQRKEDDLTGIVGSDRLNKGPFIQFRLFIFHPYYDNKQVINDIALVKKALIYSTEIAPIFLPQYASFSPTLPSVEPLAVGTKLLIVGLGSTQSYGKYSEHLKGIELPIVDGEICKNYTNKHRKKEKEKEKYHPGMLCIGNLSVWYHDMCYGDTGDPATMNGTIYALVSWGWKKKQCGPKGLISIFTNVIYYVTWIRVVFRNLGYLIP